MSPRGPRLSLGKLALYSLGAAAAVLGAGVLLLAVLRPSPVISLVIVAVALVGAVAAIGIVSNRMVGRAMDDHDAGAERRERENPDSGTH
ncbi:hypothetical protein GCM10027289_03280 [Tsukamurella serpentis]